MNYLWLEMYRKAKKYYEQNGNLRIKRENMTEEEFAINNWIKEQRVAYENRELPLEQREYMIEPLTDRQVELLEKIGMIWGKSALWEKMYEEAKKYYEQNGNLVVPETYKIKNGYSLHHWITSQRRKYLNQKQSPKKIKLITENQIKQLEKIGMIWEPSSKSAKEKWEETYNEARKYYEEHGNLRVPQTYKTKYGIRLINWISYQRQAYKNRTIKEKKIYALTDEQVTKLENIGMIWEPISESEKKWMEFYEKAKKYYEKHGNLKITRTTKDEEGRKLGYWIYKQQESYKNRNISKKERPNNYAPLSDEKTKMLENIGMIWETRQNNWNEKFKKAKEYYQEHKNLNVPHTYVTEDGVTLGEWISTQRHAYKNRTIPKEERKVSVLPLTEEKIELLESIEMIWDLKEFYLMNNSITKEKQKKLEKRFLEFLSYYIKENKNEIENYNDILKVVNSFIETLGTKENHYKAFTKIKK